MCEMCIKLQMSSGLGIGVTKQPFFQFFSRNLKGFQEAQGLEDLILEIVLDTVDSRIASSLQNTIQSGAPIDLAGQQLSNAAIVTSTINSTSIGTTTPSTGKFTTLDACANVSFIGTLGNLAWNSLTSTLSLPTSLQVGNFTFSGSTVTSSSNMTLAPANGLLSLNTTTISAPASTLTVSALSAGNLTLSGTTLSSISNINMISGIGGAVNIPGRITVAGGAGSTINSTTIGATTPSTGAFTGITTPTLTFTGGSPNSIVMPNTTLTALRFVDTSGSTLMSFNSVTDTVNILNLSVTGTFSSTSSLNVNINKTSGIGRLQTTNNNQEIGTLGATGGAVRISTAGISSNNIELISVGGICAMATNAIILDAGLNILIGSSANPGVNIDTGGTLQIGSATTLSTDIDTIGTLTLGTSAAGITAAAPLTISSLTLGRVPFVSVSGLIVDDAALTFSGGTLSSTMFNATATYNVAGTQVIGVQQPSVTTPVGGVTIDTESRTAITTLIARLVTHGLIAP